MSKSIAFLAVIAAAGFIWAGSASAAANVNYVTVTSCKQLDSGIRVSRNGGAKYTLANGCRDAGHGPRNYSMSCVSNKKYRVSWTVCTKPRDTAAPTVSLLASKSSYNVGEYIYVTVNANDNVGVSYVAIFENGVLVKNCQNTNSCGYSRVVNANIYGAMTYTAKAYDAAGNVGDSNSVSVNIYNNNDTVSPTVTISTDKWNYYSDEEIAVRARASDNNRVAKIQIFKDDQWLYTCDYKDVCDYTVLLAYSASDYNVSFYARAFDTAGNITKSDTITVHVNSRRSDTSSPRATISGSVNADGYYTINARATDADSPIRKIEVYLNDIQGPAHSWQDAANNSYDVARSFNGWVARDVNNKFVVKVWDAYDNTGVSDPLFLTYGGGSPAVSVSHRSYQSDGVDYVELNASASDNTGIQKIEIYSGADSYQNNLPVTKRCSFSSGFPTSYTCSLAFPLSVLRNGYYWSKVWDTSGNVAASGFNHYSY